MVLRSYTGGYHSDSRVFCYLGSNLVLLVPVYTQAVFYKTSLAWLLAVLLVSAGIIFLLSPMHSKNRKLDKEEQKHFGRKARLIAALELAVLLAFCGMQARYRMLTLFIRESASRHCSCS